MYVLVIPDNVCGEFEGGDFGDVERILHREGFNLKGIEFFIRCCITKQGGITIWEASNYFAGCKERPFANTTSSRSSECLDGILKSIEDYILGAHAEESCGVIIPPDYQESMIGFFETREYKTNVQTTTQFRTRLRALLWYLF